MDKKENRDDALALFLQYNGLIRNQQIAEILGEKEKTVSCWKVRYEWINGSRAN